MARREKPMSWWEVAEMVWERRVGAIWEHIGARHGISGHKAKREVARFARMAGREVS